MPKKLKIFTDGACSGNPGLASIGFVIEGEKGFVKEFSQAIGNATNNIAEYMAVIYALQEALVLKADEVFLYSDSELLCRQLLGQYKVRNENIKTLFDQVCHLVKGFRKFEVKHIPRAENKVADSLAKKAIKEQAKMVASAVNTVGEESPSSKG